MRWLAVLIGGMRRMDAYPDLVVGESYMCLVSARRLESREVLGVVEPVVPPPVLTDVAVARVCEVEIRDGRGGSSFLPRGRVLWPERDHRAIVTGTSVLGLRLLPLRRSPPPRWRVGGVWVGAPAMAELGRLLQS